MNEIQELVTNKITAVIASGAVEKAMEAKIEQMIVSAVDSALASYSGASKQLKEKIEGEMNIAIGKINFDEHRVMMQQIIQQAVDQNIILTVKEKFKQTLFDVLGNPPEKVELSEILQQYMKDMMEYSDDTGASIELEIVNSCVAGGIDLKIRGKEDRYPTSVKRWELSLYLKEAEGGGEYEYEIGIVHRINDGKVDMYPCLYGVNRLIYQMYCAGSKLVFDLGMDADCYDTSMEQDC